MKEILIIIFVFANLSSFLMACDFHDDEYFSRYEWPRVSFNKTTASHTSTANETDNVSSSSEKKQPDFRYNRVRSSDAEDNSNESSAD